MDTQSSRSRRIRDRYIRKNQIKTKGKDEEIVIVVKEIKQVDIKALREDEHEIDDKVVLKKEKVYISKDNTLRLEVIQLHYDIPIARYKESGRQQNK